MEPPVPKPEGYRFITNADSEMHYLLKAILLRPIHLPEQPDGDDTKHMILLRAYRDLCTPPENEPPWPAYRMEPTEKGPTGAPGPFERGWKCDWKNQRSLVVEVHKKNLLHDGNAEACSSPALWITKEMEVELEETRESYFAR